jgi:Chromo (CHRromatin Organisation MOdifier) domain
MYARIIASPANRNTKRYGPFTVTEEISPVVYRVELPQQWKIHNVFHTSLLMPYKEMEEHGNNYAQPPPELVEGEEEYEVKQVLNSRRTGCAKKLQYLLRWKGYSRAHDSWQDATEVHAPELVAKYLARKPSAVWTTTLKGHAGGQGNPIFMNSLHTPYGEDDEVLLFTNERCNTREVFCNHAWMEAQLQSPSSTPTTSLTTSQFGEAPTKCVVAHPPKEGGDVTIPRERPDQPDRPDRPGQGKMRSTAHMATRQKCYDESTFSARLAKVLQRHGMTVRTTCTSSSVMRDIMYQLARLASKGSTSSSNEDVPARHDPRSPERPP